MVRLFILIVVFLYSLSTYAQSYPLGTQSVYIADTPNIRQDLLTEIASIINHSIQSGEYPGAIVLVSHRQQIIYRGVFGNRRIKPDIVPMTFDTIFDLASLTKVVATLPAIMKLVEEGKCSLDDKVCEYWPEFATNKKSNITLRELLTHTSGLPPVIHLHGHTAAEGYDAISKVALINKHGTTFVYSDLNFIVLAHLIELISKDSFDSYVRHHVFNPLGMNDTQFMPQINTRNRIAPTEGRWGEVNDPMAHAMGGISGNAGLFSTATDLGIYADFLINGGRLPQTIQQGQTKINYLLGPLTILKMTSIETPRSIKDQRGLGWDIDSYFSNRGDLLTLPSYGHTGWTGTSLWIDPNTETWIIILTSRTHPHPTELNGLANDRKKIANIVAGSLTDVSILELNNVGEGEHARAYPNIKKKGSFLKLWSAFSTLDAEMKN